MTLPHDDVLAAAHHAILDIATAAITSPDDDRHDLLARAVDWLASSREHTALHRILLRDADRLTLDAHLARWT